MIASEHPRPPRRNLASQQARTNVIPEQVGIARIGLQHVHALVAADSPSMAAPFTRGERLYDAG
jgi:hypothetical protein